MNISFGTVLNQNITLVYDSLEPRNVNTAGLKGLLGSTVNPVIMDTPEIIVAIYPPKPTIVQVGDRRVRITVQQSSAELGDVPLWDYAEKLHSLINNEHNKLLAYGFNYDVGFESDEKDVNLFILNNFLKEKQSFAEKLGGKIDVFIPRFKFWKDTTLYDLIIETIDEQHIKLHLNAHFEIDDHELPASDQLKSSFLSEYDYLNSLVPKLFQS